MQLMFIPYCNTNQTINLKENTLDPRLVGKSLLPIGSDSSGLAVLGLRGDKQHAGSSIEPAIIQGSGQIIERLSFPHIIVTKIPVQKTCTAVNR